MICVLQYDTIRPGQLLMCSRVKTVLQGRERERERSVCSACGCVSLNLSPLHTPQPCVRVSTRAEADESTGVRELEAGPVDREEEPTGGGTEQATGRVSLC